jgi:GNAT superfamily N-acetyltransferase
MTAFSIRPVSEGDKKWVISLTREWWAGPEVVTRGKIHDTGKLPGFIAVHEGKRAGLATYEIIGTECEIVTMNSLTGGIGIGTALIDAIKKAATAKGCKRLWLITTNDNTHALRFYQKYGLQISAVNIRAIEKERILKPGIPLTGNDGIPIRDEIEMEMRL